MRRWRKLACAAVRCSSSVVLDAPGALAGPAGAFFIVASRLSHSAPDDPIVFPRLPSHSHDHSFIGNVSTNPFTTPASLAGHATTCSDTDDLSSYWAPTPCAAGTPVKPLEVTIYYRRLTQAPVRPFPRGLEMVAGNSHALTPQNPSVTEWYCGVLKSSFYAPLARAGATTPARRPGALGVGGGPAPVHPGGEPRAAGQLPRLARIGARRAPTTGATWPIRSVDAARSRTRSLCPRSRPSSATRRSRARTCSSRLEASTRAMPTAWTAGRPTRSPSSSRAASTGT